MANRLDIFDPIFYAQEGLIQLEKALGMAARIHRGHDKAPQQKGSVISIPIPSTFVAQDAPSTAQDIKADHVDIKLDRWKEVKFALSDKELSYTTTEIIDNHIRPAAYALADEIDQFCCSFYQGVPWAVGTAGSTPAAVSDITGARKMLFNNAVPLVPGLIHLMIDGNAEDKFLQLAAFSQQQGAGDTGVATQMRGTLGMKYGMEIFANQNVKTHTKGTCSVSTLAVNNNPAGYVQFDEYVNLDAVAVTGTLVAGDVLYFASHNQRYTVVGGPYTASGNAFNNVQLFPKLKQAVADNEVVTVVLQNGVRNLAFHRNFAALAMAPLSDLPSRLGAQVATIADPKTGLALRSRVYYVGDTSTVKVALDVLYGGRVLDGNLATALLG